MARHRETADILVSETELFAARGRHTEEERRIFGELAGNFLPRASVRDRRRIAATLAAHPQTPVSILTLLAQDDDLPTAYPVLSQAPRLAPELLEEMVRKGPESLRQAIAKRSDLTEEVHLALASAAQSTDTVRTLLQNVAFSLTPAVASRLMQRSEMAAALEDDLAALGALSPKALMEQYFHLPKPQRAQALAAAEQASLIERAIAGRTAAPADPVFVAFLLRTAKSHAPYKVHEEIGQALALPAETVRHLAADNTGETLAIALRSLGFEETSATTVFIRLLGRRMGIQGIRKVLNLFNGISRGGADQLVRSWSSGSAVAGSRVESPRHAPLTAEPRAQRGGSQTIAKAPADQAKPGLKAVAGFSPTAKRPFGRRT
ncbi:hypothetical protein GCM10011316_23560 [Roseibium aquae]|uniref:DUF2336 domain-containing protein n=1 Tax=Roseibium aquae TaxID=1323746 RepID=A0A916TK00_9HYPH|nr:hypothetical protein GCM10011316_23560 [Roseibium aquae]